MLNVLLIRPGEQPVSVTVPENAVALTEPAIRALIGAANTERHPGLWAGVIGDLYTDAKAVAQNTPVNDAASELRTAAIRQRNPASKDAAVLRGAALLVQTMPEPVSSWSHISGTFANEAERQAHLAGPDGAKQGIIVEAHFYDTALDEDAIRRLAD